MRKAGLGALLWRLLFLSDLQVAAIYEEKYVLAEGQTLQVDYHFSSWEYSYSQKTLQRLVDEKKPLILVITKMSLVASSKVQVGRYFLEAIHNEAILSVSVRNLLVEDSGLYQCVINQPPKKPIVLSPMIRLEVTKDSSSNSSPVKEIIGKETQKISHTYITKSWGKFPGIETQFPTKTTVRISSTSRGVNLTSVTDGFNLKNTTDTSRISVFSIVITVICGLLSKFLVFTILWIITQQSLVSRPLVLGD